LQLAVGNADTLLCRVGSPIADLIIPSFRKENRPYGLEVVVDPNDAMGPGAFRHPLRPFFRIFATKSLKTHCSRAVGVAYVTRERLQRSYPCPAHSVGISDVAQLDFTKTPKVFTTSYSSITSENTEFIDHPRNFAMADCPRILFIGSLAQLYKGPDVLLKAIRMLRPLMRLEVFIVGDGKYRGELEKLAHKLGVSDSIHFLGELPSGVAIRQQLDKATLFVMPSRAEGLPRAMVEAMTRAVPSIGSRVGGIPELLDDQDLVKPGDVNDLAHKIQEVLANPLRLSEMSERNLRRSHEYAPAILNQRRGEFYRFLRKATEQWHGEKQRH
jgi:glycosyltransferase involved in cell wall biosynthesis